MYFLGVAPLLMVALLRRSMRETVRFSDAETIRVKQQRPRCRFFDPMKRCIASGGGPYRGRLILVATLCNCIGLVGGPTISFFSLYAKRDHHWTSARVGRAVVLAYLMGTFGTLLSGYLLDRIGRRATATLFFLGASISMALLFQSESDRAILLGLMATMFAYQGSRTATATLTAELFPTVARATGFSLTVQVFGQLGWTLAPLMAGLLSAPMGGLGNAASLFSIGPIIGAIVVLAYVPETRGKTLEELSPESNTDEASAQATSGN
jgi:MFS family permease